MQGEYIAFNILACRLEVEVSASQHKIKSPMRRDKIAKATPLQSQKVKYIHTHVTNWREENAPHDQVSPEEFKQAEHSIPSPHRTSSEEGSLRPHFPQINCTASLCIHLIRAGSLFVSAAQTMLQYSRLG